MRGTLYVVPTPLGNLKDITERAKETLQNVSRIACEDTRRTLILLNALNIHKPLLSYHAHSGMKKESEILSALGQGENIALVTDAGTPGISDPGAILISKAIEAGYSVEALPGPCAAVTALSASGLPTDHFVFLGFLPRRSIRQARLFQSVAGLEMTGVFYESPFRVIDTLETLQKTLGDAVRVTVGRELTKKFEEYIRGSVTDVITRLKEKEVKGEVTVVFNQGCHSERSEES